MAVLNTTPDSFYDGGQFDDAKVARNRIDALLSEGADIIDVGAESTRPGAAEVEVEEQLRRAVPAIEYAVKRGAWVSIDTTRAAVAREALRLGAKIVNDVSCLRDPSLAEEVAKQDADLIIMHSRGSMSDISGSSSARGDGYTNVAKDLEVEWKAAKGRAVEAGLEESRIWFDPGLGFHKNAEQSHELMARLGEFSGLGVGLVLGASRKSFLGALDESSPERRLGGSLAACLAGVKAGASVLRVHDVHDTRQALLAARKWGQLGEAQALGGAA